MSHSQKRKYSPQRLRNSPPPQLAWLSTDEGHLANRPDAALFIVAHEADVLRGREETASMLEAPQPGDGVAQKNGKGSGLIKLEKEGLDDDIWVDRYDARLLLSSLPALLDPIANTDTPSPTGWSDLPSDTEDTFFFSAAEADEYRSAKRRRLLESARDTRLRAMRFVEGEPDEEGEDDQWGGSDEEPDAAELELMRRTAMHILASPNPVQLETRILANHGADKRFAFLRGRWKRAWLTTKLRVKDSEEKESAEKAKATSESGLAGLGDYGDSDDDDSGSDKLELEDGSAPPHEASDAVDEAKIKEARRARAREWSAKRRADKSVQEG